MKGIAGIIVLWAVTGIPLPGALTSVPRHVICALRHISETSSVPNTPGIDGRGLVS
jgi:hypothetical protein